ncbi:MAG: hypothetical protein ACI841_001832, partial [Planctomycetota bacterium]
MEVSAKDRPPSMQDRLFGYAIRALGLRTPPSSGARYHLRYRANDRVTKRRPDQTQTHAMSIDLHMKPTWLSLLLALVISSGAAHGQGTEIGFAETFALSTDRAKVLEQLIPGTRDFYYYNCLERQGAGDFEEVEKLLKVWIQRHGRTGRVEMIENRQALLNFQRDPAATYQFLASRIRARFDHQRETGEKTSELPTQLDADLLSHSNLTARALREHRGTLDGFRDSAIEGMASSDLDEDRLMSLLKRLQRPDVANLPALIVRNLGHRRSKGFGSLNIHARLLLEQLEECVSLNPELLQESKFVEIYLHRLRPGADTNREHNAVERVAYLERLQGFAQRLNSAHNSLKAHVLFHRLTHDLRTGQQNKARFMAYLRLPRNGSYVSPEHARSHRRGDQLVNLRADFPTSLSSIGHEEQLIHTYLSGFFLQEDNYATYSQYLHNDYLRRLFAETKIMAGDQDMERWYSMLDDPSYYEQLKERVEIEFAPTQATHYARDEAVALDVDLKNVDTLIVKLFEINTFNYYREVKRDVDAAIDLDGLVANEERTIPIEMNALRRHRRRFELPSIDSPGVYIVELIGNGLSSRAVIQKGRLQLQQRVGAAGHVMRVLDETGTLVPQASIWFGGRDWHADQFGEIAIPFSTDPGTKRVMLRNAQQTSLANFYHQGESYELDASFLLDRESLLPGRMASVLVRPSLRVNGRPIDIAALESARLEITSIDRDGTPATLVVPNFQLSQTGESHQEIKVPEGLARLQLRLHAQIRSLSRAEDVDLASNVRTL